jgi:hypothetical protein
MTVFTLNDAGSVRLPMIAHAAAIGSISITPEVAKQKCGDEAGMLLRDA